jgi:hypothetical protein
MKKKVLASIAAGLVIFGGVFTPMFSLLGPTFETQYAEAADEDKNVGVSNDICTKTGDDSFTCGLMSAISEVITFVPISIASITGMIFDYSIWNSIQSGTYTKYDRYDDSDASSEGLVVMGWKLVRDFTNLVFIFALFVIAFTLILDLDGGGDRNSVANNPKRIFARVVMMALLVNFSFFLARSVIDVTNKFALQFYTNMTNAPQVATGDGAQDDVNSFYTLPGNSGIRSIAAGIIAKINPQSLLLDSSTAKVKPGAGLYANLFLFSFISAAFGIFLAYIFMSIAILFIGRIIGLYLAVIISPLAFVSYTIPALQNKPYIGFDDWMKQFIGLAFMAPVFLFFIYIGVQFFDLTSGSTSGSLAKAAQIIFKFMIVAMFFTLAKRIAKDMSGKIGDMATAFVTGAITSVATIGAAAVTGGASAAWVATKREAASNLQGIGNRTIGKENTEIWQNRLGGLKNFSALRSDPRKAMFGLTTALTGSAVPGQIDKSITKGQDLGDAMNRLNRMKSDRKQKSEDQKKMERAAAEIEAKKKADEAAAKTKAAGTPTGSTTKPTGIGVAPKPAMPSKDAKLTLRPENTTTPATGTTTTTAPTTKTPTGPSQNNAGPGGANPRSSATPGGDDSRRPTNTFNSNVDFDRPKNSTTTTSTEKPTGLVDQYGNPVSSAGLAQKEESEKLARQYAQEDYKKRQAVQVENLDVKNLKVEQGIKLPSRPSNTGATPQKQATTLLSGIQMAPRATSGALNFKPSDFKPSGSAPEPIWGSEENDDILRAQVNGRTTSNQSPADKLRQSYDQQFSDLQKRTDIDTKTKDRMLGELETKRDQDLKNLK